MLSFCLGVAFECAGCPGPLPTGCVVVGTRKVWRTHSTSAAALPLPPLPAWRQVICTKVRDGDKRIVRLKEGTARGRHVVIVDDLVQSGGWCPGECNS